jgi:Pentapeptide repeats (8 copies)
LPDAELRADCERCLGLCCVAPALARSADFAISKPAGVPCPNLLADDRCAIHADLRSRGFPGCSAYDCFGAGQRVSALGAEWRCGGEQAARLFAAFAAMRTLHELRWYLIDVLERETARPLHAAARAALAGVEGLAAGSLGELAVLDADATPRQVGGLLRRVSELVRAGTPAAPERVGADLAGIAMRGARLRRADLRGAYLMAADLTGADLREADLLGADLRGAQLAGADLRGALYLTQQQLGGTLGDSRTRISARLLRPPHWRDGSSQTVAP